jgi:outer membrane immunogenic protein
MRFGKFGRLGAFIALAASTVPSRAQFRTTSGPSGADFSGVGVGADIGAGIGANSSINTSGVAGGAHLGYNLQSGPIVGGVEADALLGNITGQGAGTFRQSWLTSARIKGGYSLGDILAYGTLGEAWSTTSFESLGYTANKTLTGVVFGVGAEYAVTRSVTLRAELRRYDFNSATYYLPTGAPNVTTETNLLLVGASAHF